MDGFSALDIHELQEVMDSFAALLSYASDSQREKFITLYTKKSYVATEEKIIVSLEKIFQCSSAAILCKFKWNETSNSTVKLFLEKTDIFSQTVRYINVKKIKSCSKLADFETLTPNILDCSHYIRMFKFNLTAKISVQLCYIMKKSISKWKSSLNFLLCLESLNSQ